MQFKVLRESLYFFRSHFKLFAVLMIPSLLLALLAQVLEDGSLEVSLFHSLVIYPLYNVFLLFIIDKLVKSEELVFENLLSRSASLWFPMMTLTVLSSIVIWGGFLLLIIPGVWLFVRLLLSPMYVVFDGLSSLQALKQSFDDSESYQLESFFTVIPFIVVYVFYFFFQTWIQENNFASVFFIIAFDFTFVLLSIIQYRLYDLHIKKPA